MEAGTRSQMQYSWCVEIACGLGSTLIAKTTAFANVSKMASGSNIDAGNSCFVGRSFSCKSSKTCKKVRPTHLHIKS